MPKPKNDGQILTVRVSTGTHAAISRILGLLAEQGEVPSLRTKARVIEQAIEHL